jgi:hypothetical protein
MPLPAILGPFLRDRRFWRRLVGDDAGERVSFALDTCRVVFPVGGSTLELVLRDALGACALVLGEPGPQRVVVEDSLRARTPSAVLRWEEPELAHPGLAVALLGRFAPVCQDDDAEASFRMREAAWRSVGVSEVDDLERFLARADARNAAWSWKHREPEGWTIVEDIVLSGRRPRVLYGPRQRAAADAESVDEFPFAALRRLVARARERTTGVVDERWFTPRARELLRRIVARGDLAAAPDLARALEEGGCGEARLLEHLRSENAGSRAWVVELLQGAEPGSLVGRLLPPLTRAPRWELRVHLAFAPSGPTGKTLADVLASKFQGRDWGSARVEDSKYPVSVRRPDAWWIVRVVFRRELEPGLSELRRVLASLHAPASTTIELVAPDRRAIPLEGNYSPLGGSGAAGFSGSGT